MTLFATLGTVLLALLGQPLFVIILAFAMIGFTVQDIPLSVIGAELYRLSDTPLLAAIPLFTFVGFLLSESKSSTRIVKLTDAFFGWMPSGLAFISLTTCAFFTAFTGASGATIVALGALLLPALRHAKYPEKFSLGLVTSAGSLGLLLAPSVPLILFGILAQQMNQGFNVTIEDLFIAGLMPTALMIIMLALYSFFAGGKAARRTTPFSMKNTLNAVWEAKWEIPLPVFVLGGIYSGYFAVSEAAAMTVFYTFVVEVLIYREIPFRDLKRITAEAMIMVGGIMLVLATAMALGNYFIDAQVPMLVFEFIQTYVDSKLTFLLLLNLFLLLLGAVLDIFAALVLVVPLILPVAVAFGVDPVHLGIIFLANLQIGYMTPPIGMNLFIASYRFDEPVTKIYKASFSFMLVLLVALIAITYIPWLSLAFIR